MRTIDELQDYMTKATTVGFASPEEALRLREMFLYDCFYWLPKLIPVYKQREPLSDKDIGKGFLQIDVWHRYECFRAGVKWTEEQHSITGVDDV